MEKIYKIKDCVITIKSNSKTVNDIPGILNDLSKEIRDQIKSEKGILEKTFYLYDSFYNTIKECKPVKHPEGYRLMSYIMTPKTLVKAVENNEKIGVDDDIYHMFGLHYVRVSDSKEKLVDLIKADIDKL